MLLPEMHRSYDDGTGGLKKEAGLAQSVPVFLGKNGSTLLTYLGCGFSLLTDNRLNGSRFSSQLDIVSAKKF